MLPRRTIPAAKAAEQKDRSSKKKPTLDEFLSKNDWSGALGLLQFEKNTENSSAEDQERLTMWMIYSAFHLGDYRKSVAVSSSPYHSEDLQCACGNLVGTLLTSTCLQLLDELINHAHQPEPVWNLHKAACLFYLGKPCSSQCDLVCLFVCTRSGVFYPAGD